MPWDPLKSGSLMQAREKPYLNGLACVPFQLVCVPAGITAQAALERTLPSVRANVTF